MTTSPASTQPGIDPATLAPRTPVEVRAVDSVGAQILAYAYPDGWRASPHDFYALSPWDGWRVVRVLADAKPAQEPVLPRPIEPEDVRVGMVVERRKDDVAFRDRVQRIDGDLITGAVGAWLWVPTNADGGWSLWLIEDAPAPVDPDADLIEAMALAAFAAGNKCLAWESTTDGAREAYLIEARAALAVVRAHDAKAGA